MFKSHDLIAIEIPFGKKNTLHYYGTWSTSGHFLKYGQVSVILIDILIIWVEKFKCFLIDKMVVDFMF